MLAILLQAFRSKKKKPCPTTSLC